MPIRITTAACGCEREPRRAPLGFKGGALTEVWQTAVLFASASGNRGLGLGTQSPLWSDARVFRGQPERVGNEWMFALTQFAAERAKACEWQNPLELLDRLLPLTLEHGRRLTGQADLRLTFALNALVAVDNAAWQLYAREHRIARFDDLVPAPHRAALGARHRQLAAIPLMSYGVPLPAIVRAVDDGYFLLKIKIGSDPDQDGDPAKMLAWDQQRLTQIHDALRDRQTPHTASGQIPYYLDANGRYESKDRLLRLLDHAEKIGARDRIVVLEEPFPEESEVDVADVPVPVAADESAHSDADVLRRIQMGYRIIALKPIAKTLSMSLKMAAAAHEHAVPCFCADLTVNPILVDWNKNVAGRLAPLPGMNSGVLESNGHQNYRNWEQMKRYHPCQGASWTEVRDGRFPLDDDFYACNGGIFETSEHYADLVQA